LGFLYCRIAACPFTLCRGFFTPKIVGTFYMQGYKVKEKIAIVPPVSKLSGHPGIDTIYVQCLKISNSFALAAKEDRKTCQRFPFLPVSKKIMLCVCLSIFSENVFCICKIY
jgi:hypothetical protein